jgi:acyl transferase domain-containing protein
MDLYWKPGGGPGVMYVRHFGMLSTEWNDFDNKFFGISDHDAQTMDPFDRKQLEVGYECLARGGWTMQTLKDAHMAMCTGSGGSDGWAIVGPTYNGPRGDEYHYFSQALAMCRSAYTFGMRGPTQTCDTACSSSLMAVCVMHMHMRPLEPGQMRSGFHGVQCKAGIAWGVQGFFQPNFTIGLCQAGMLTHQGRCFSFDSSADGFARAEGCSSMHYQCRTQENLADLCMLASTNMNQDGRSASLTAPNGPSQQECIRGSLREANISPFDIHCQELHGTGTALGDPIEVGGLRATMMKQDGKVRTHPLVKTTYKSNCGHMETNAGISGLMKCVLLGMHGAIPGGLHLRLCNPHIDYNGYPVHFAQEFMDSGNDTGFIGVSSFGFSGCNARGDIWARASAGIRKVIPIGLNLAPSRLQLFNKLDVPYAAVEYNVANPDTQAAHLKEGGTASSRLAIQ